MRVRNVLLRPSLLLAVGLTLLLLVATGCGLAPATTPRASDRWSNGKLVGIATLNNQVALQVDDVGHSFMVWVGLEHKLNFARLNERADVVVQQPLDLRTDSPLKPQLRMDATGQMHLTWLDKRERGLQLFYARLSADGAVVQEATALSPPEWRAAHSSMVLDPVGRTVQVFWSDNVYSRPGCYHAALDWSGEVVVPAEMLIQDGILPVAQVDRQGFVHLAWRVESEAERPRFHYAVYDPQRRALGSDIVASEPLVQMGLLGGPTAGATFDGPWLGLDERSVYLVWVLEVRERGDVRDFSFYQAFPQPTLSPRDVADTFDYPLPEVTGGAVYVAFPGADPSMTGQPWFLEGHPAHQVLACFTQVSGPGGSEMLQIAAIDVGPGQITGHEIVNASRGASLQPNVAVDPSGNLHLAWIDTAGFSRYQVIYASTLPQAREALNRVTAYDVVDKILSGAMYVLSSLFFAPLVLVWMFIPIGWLLVFALITGESEISDPRGRRALVIALILHLGAQLFLFPDLLARFPFGSLLSPSLGFLVGRWIFPLLLAGLSAGVAWVTLKRGRGQSIFAPYLVFAAVDSFFILVIYVALPLVG
ncbi:MAG TPA: hypothetical protein VMY40_01275 [Anaerolineae bacterium]|nr:hypothetical protein [Anaerolineae bacterium]